MMSEKLGLDSSKFHTASKTDDLLGDEDWGFTPRCLMDDGERFKDCIKLKCICTACRKETSFSGLITDSGSSGLNCPSCGAIYFGRGLPADAYSYLSNRLGFGLGLVLVLELR
jgi:hypothetical protein